MPAVAVFLAGAAVSLATSLLLVSRLERIGERLGLSEALLGIVAALAADAPEISAAVSAMASHQQRVGAGIVLGSNVFNLAALLGLGAVVAGRIALHRKVVVLGGAVALWVALVCVLVVTGLLSAAAGLVLAVVVLAVYLVVLGTEGRACGACRGGGGRGCAQRSLRKRLSWRTRSGPAAADGRMWSPPPRRWSSSSRPA